MCCCVGRWTIPEQIILQLNVSQKIGKGYASLFSYCNSPWHTDRSDDKILSPNRLFHIPLQWDKISVRVTLQWCIANKQQEAAAQLLKYKDISVAANGLTSELLFLKHLDLQHNSIPNIIRNYRYQQCT